TLFCRGQCVCVCSRSRLFSCAVLWCGVVWCGVVWCGVLWCAVVWCGCCGVLWCAGVGCGGVCGGVCGGGGVCWVWCGGVWVLCCGVGGCVCVCVCACARVCVCVTARGRVREKSKMQTQGDVFLQSFRATVGDEERRQRIEGACNCSSLSGGRFHREEVKHTSNITRALSLISV